ncbi:BrnT family toxin [Ursidibacter arcticus]
MNTNFIHFESILFEYDPNKSLSNLAKHGIDFEQAKQLWKDETRILLTVKLEPEIRYLIIGKIAQKHWTAIYTMRNGCIRIISVRRARKQERNYYESYN